MQISRSVLGGFALASGLFLAAGAHAQTVPGYVVDTYAGALPIQPMDLTFDPATGAFFVGDRADPGRIYRIGAGGSPVTAYGVSTIADPDGVIFDVSGAVAVSAGSVLVSSGTGASGAIFEIAPDESISTRFGPSTFTPQLFEFDGTGRLLISDPVTNAVWSTTGAAPVVLFNTIDSPMGIVVDAADNIYTAEATGGVGAIRIHDSAGAVVDNSFVTGLAVSQSLSLAIGGGSGIWGADIYTIETGTGNLLRIDNAGGVTVIGSGFDGDDPIHLEFGPDNALYVSESNNTRVLRIAPDCNSNGDPDTCDLPGNDCNSNGVPDECELAGNDCNTDGVPDDCQSANWIGPDGGLFTSAANWNPATVPTAGATLANATTVDNRAVLGAPGETAVCTLSVQTSNTGKQILQISGTSTLRAGGGTNVTVNGVIDLHGGQLAGGTAQNAGDIVGYGTVSAAIDNSGLVEGSSPGNLLLTGSRYDNQSSGILRAPFGSFVNVQCPTVTQNGLIEVRTFAGMLFAVELVNEAFAQIDLLGGALSANGLTNEFLADIDGFGRIESNVNNFGTITIVADTEIVGNFANAGTVRVQSGTLTIVGNLTGGGSLDGGGGTRSAPPQGAPRSGDGITVIGDLSLDSSATLTMADRPLKVGGDFDVAIDDFNRVELTQGTLQLVGVPDDGPQLLEMLAEDVGRFVTLPDPSLFSIDTLRFGPTSPSVQLADAHDNGPGAGAEALYVSLLILEPGTRLDFNGLIIYYETVIPNDPFDPGSGIEILDSAGGGNLLRIVVGLPGDYDVDGDVDLADYGGWPGCMTGPNGGPVAAGCEPFDFNTDDDVDIEDFGSFQTAYQGGP